ncbi:hypothetical protein [Synechococcus sp. PCC 7502]|uniref:hypothetical protein n=1 Tax=Synechococcus sp. PCC 7502 TaxID=1173263 RepID=UPI00059CE0C2|nr:hypothetical protein [Synechococcus sp. PCC 7502]
MIKITSFWTLFLLNVITASSLNVQAQNWSGTYYRNKANGKVVIREGKKSKQRAIDFNLSVGNPPPYLCIGKLDGYAQWITANIAEYNVGFNTESDSCRLTFIFSSNQLIVRETNCDAHHGVSCNFEGLYSR